MVIDYELSILLASIKLNRYRQKTLTLYKYANTKFLEYIQKSPREITKDETKKYLINLYNAVHVFSVNHHSAEILKSYYEVVLNHKPRYQTHLIESGIKINYSQFISGNTSLSINNSHFSKFLRKTSGINPPNL